MNIEEKARALVEPIVVQGGFELWDVVFEKEGAMNYLRVLFDNSTAKNSADTAANSADTAEFAADTAANSADTAEFAADTTANPADTAELRGITDEDCARMTAPINALLDKQDFIKHVDILEIGSPGLTRRLRHAVHFAASLGKPLRVTKRGDKGKTVVIYGVLVSYDGDSGAFELQGDKGILQLSLKNCIRVNLDL
ncbi:MAG: hypothetical protein FWH20_01990 [Oscillospiraceae bacterium]|nr:hypothetical protein [Oscillospiraceae bacterium]